MSLTSHLRDRKSPIRRFFDDHLGNIAPVFEEVRSRAKGCAVIRAPADSPDGTLGTAFGFRVRMYFVGPGSHGVVPPNLRGYLGGGIVWDPGPTPEAVLGFRKGCRHEVPRLCRVTPNTMTPREECLIRYCFVLAWFEELYRAGGFFGLPGSPILQNRYESAEHLLGLAPPEWLEDTRALSYAFRHACEDLIHQPVVLDPDLEGSLDVGGADPDLIVDRQLLELKAVARITKDRFTRALYQVLGYALLDFDDTYRIRSAAIYFARHGLLCQWRLRTLLGQLSNGKITSLREARSALEVVTEGDLRQR